MRSRLSALTLVCLLGGIQELWAAPLPDGKYVYQSEPEDCRFELIIPKGRMGKPVILPFSAQTLSGFGPAPEGEIRGTPVDGLWKVTFTDSFENSGQGTILLKAGVLFLTMKLDQVEEPRCARFYGSMRLLKQAKKKGPLPKKKGEPVSRSALVE